MSDEKPPGEAEKPKIIVDEDWKSEAEAEKERLASREASGPPPRAGEAGAEAGRPPAELPQATFSTLVTGLVTQALFTLGAIEDPETGQRYRNLPLSKHHIDTLAVLEAKTAGNLTDEEKELLDNALYEVRMHYVRIAQTG